MPIFATAGTKLAIGTVMADQTADFEAVDFTGTFTEIAALESLGTLGDSATEVTFEGIDAQRTKRLKGTRNAAPMEVVCGLDVDDPGQQALIAAEQTSDNYAFRVTFLDGSLRYFIAIVGSQSETYDAANNVVKLNASLWVNSNTVRA